jgi:DNA-binding transcriptional regulator LsrR (DeoR family)
MSIKNHDADRDRLAIAALIVEDRLTQRQIAAITGKSQPEVSRLYHEACDRGLVVEEIRWPEGTDRSVVDEVAFENREELQKHLERLSKTTRREGRPPFQKLHIVHGGSDEDEWELFGRKAALVVGSLARAATVVGVAWGRNIDRVVRSMPAQPPDPSKIVLPVAGEPLKHRAAKLGATDAAALLAEKFGSQRTEHLLGVGHRIPAHLADPVQVKTIRDYLASSSSYVNIFGPSDDPAGPLIDRLQMVLTGVGSTETSQASDDPLYAETLESENAATVARSEPSLEEAAVGNVAGVWLPRDPQDDAAGAVVDRVNAHWFGISLASLQGCALRAVQQRAAKPGVVVVATEPAKAEAILAAVKAGVVSNLVVSRQLANSLLPSV